MSEEWKEVAGVDEFAEADRKMVDLGGDKQVGIFKYEGEFYAVSAWCSHQKATIMSGDLDDGAVMCPLHGAMFDLKTGEALSLPATRPIATYKLKVEDGKILIKE